VEICTIRWHRLFKPSPEHFRTCPCILGSIVAYEHHVYLDASGYPAVPKGWMPNLSSRIVQIVDVFDALRTHRPYRKALPMAKICEIMQTEMSDRFDTDLLKIFFQEIAPKQNQDQTEPVTAG
jgi:HD-GYP domain-containing protein (c-di-GMP phosphodiesterase class II)